MLYTISFKILVLFKRGTIFSIEGLGSNREGNPKVQVICSEDWEADLFMEGERGKYGRWMGEGKGEEQDVSNLLGKMGKGPL